MIVKGQTLQYMPTATSPGALAKHAGKVLQATASTVYNQSLVSLYVSVPGFEGVTFVPKVPVGVSANGYVISKDTAPATFGIEQVKVELRKGHKVRRRLWPIGSTFSSDAKVKLDYNDLMAEDWSLA